jgi:hypothetical protein
MLQAEMLRVRFLFRSWDSSVACNHYNVPNFLLLLSQGRAGEDPEASNRVTCFFPQKKVPEADANLEKPQCLSPMTPYLDSKNAPRTIAAAKQSVRVGTKWRYFRGWHE